MKKIIIICIMLIILLTLTACQSSNTENLSEQVNNLQKEINLLKTELAEVTKERDRVIIEKTDLENQFNAVQEQKELKEDEVIVEFVDKINIPKDTDNWVFSDVVLFHIGITNNSKKDIKGIQGLVDIQDMFGVSILKLNCDFTNNTIKAGETYINKDMSFEINDYIDEHVKVYMTDYENLKFVYTINKIMFTDGTLKE